MYSDVSLAELCSFAVRIGCHLSWLQVDSKIPHFDLTPRLRDRAINLGAVEKEIFDDESTDKHNPA